MRIRNTSNFGFATTKGDVMPGQISPELPEPEARRFVLRGRAELAAEPETIEVADPLPERRDPQPPRRRKK